jgi:CrcB protein
LTAPFWLALGLAGSLGAISRFTLTYWMMQWFGRSFPWGTLLVNIVGSFLMGFLAVYLLSKLHWPEPWRIVVLTGFLGAFTTFSAFSVDALFLIEREAWLKAIFYVTASVLFGLLAVRGGMLLAERL